MIKDIKKLEKIKGDLTKQVNALRVFDGKYKKSLTENKKNIKMEILKRNEVKKDLEKVKSDISIVKKEIPEFEAKRDKVADEYDSIITDINEKAQKKENALKAREESLETKIIGVNEQERKIKDRISIGQSKFNKIKNNIVKIEKKSESADLKAKNANKKEKDINKKNEEIQKKITNSLIILGEITTEIEMMREEYSDKEKDIKDFEKRTENATKTYNEANKNREYLEDKERYLKTYEAYIKNEAKKLKKKYVPFQY